jgi:hypothetical protein
MRAADPTRLRVLLDEQPDVAEALATAARRALSRHAG